MSAKVIQGSVMLGALLGTTLGVWLGIFLDKPAGYTERIVEQRTVAVLQDYEKKAGFIDDAPNREIIHEKKELTKEKNNIFDSSNTQKKEQHPKKEIPPAEPKPLPHNNKTLNNFNIMFLGIEDSRLQMLTVYTINKENSWKSGTVFIPTDTLIPGTKDISISNLFYKKGPEAVKKVIENNMEITINYYVRVDRNLLASVESYLDPIYINGEKVNLAQLFTKEITPDDEKIMASLLKNLTEPSIYFGLLPKLVLTCKKYINTDFSLTLDNLWFHYQIAKNIDTTKVTKRILPGQYQKDEEENFWIPDQLSWWNTVYDVTK